MSQASLARPLAVFGFTLILVMAVLVALSQFVELPGGSAMGVVSLLVATLPAGQSFYKAAQRRATFAEKLMFALGATLIAAVINLAVLYGILTYYGVEFSRANIMAVFQVPVQDEALFLKIVLIGGLGFTFCAIWLIFWAAIRGAEKQAAKAVR